MDEIDTCIIISSRRCLTYVLYVQFTPKFLFGSCHVVLGLEHLAPSRRHVKGEFRGQYKLGSNERA